MQILSPVGRFRASVHGVRLRDRRPVIEVSMGAWRSEATLEPRDLPLAFGAALVLAGAYLAGHRRGVTRGQR